MDAEMTPETNSCAIRVIVRVRPMSEKEKTSGQVPIVTVSKNSLQLRQPQGRGESNDIGPQRTFQYDRCFGESIQGSKDMVQQSLFEDIGRDIISNAFNGFNCSVFAYGQTGSGKTYTMVGDKTETGKGLIPRICESLFDEIEKARARDNESNGEQHKTVYSVHMNYCEIYKEKVKDLLDESRSTHARTNSQPLAIPLVLGDYEPLKSLKIREHPVHGPFVEGLITRTVGSYSEIEEELVAGQKLRTVAATLMNPTSSRSHAIFTIVFTQTRVDPITLSAHEKTSKICLVDLAGSERSDTSGTSGERLKEASMINKSLFTLGRVISSLGAKERIPYRDSTLTWLLKESLGGNAKTTMLAMVSPSSENYEESLSTLRYAESAKKIINRAVVNEDQNAAIIRQLRKQIEDLKGQLLGTQRRRSSETSAGMVKSLLEREELLGQLQRDAQKREKSIHLPVKHPSLINLQEDLLENEPLAHVLELGLTVLGSDPIQTPAAWSSPESTSSPSSPSVLRVIAVQEETEEVQPHYLHLVYDAEDVSASHAQILNDNGFLTIEPCASALVLVNGEAITQFTPLKHKDRIQIGEHHRFRVFVPSDALTSRKSNKPDNQTEEANSLCEKANIPYRFKREKSNDVGIVLSDGEHSGMSWEQPLFQERLQTLRAYDSENGDRATLVSMLGLPPLETDSCDDYVESVNSEKEMELIDGIDMEYRSPIEQSLLPLTIDIPAKTDPFMEVRSNAVRLLGKARLYIGYGVSDLNSMQSQSKDRVISVFDPLGSHVASITIGLSYVAAQDKGAGKQTDSSKWTIRIEWKEVRFFISNPSEGMYITYQKSDGSKTGSTPKCSSVSGVFSFCHVLKFDVVCLKAQSMTEVLEKAFISMDVWGWGRVPVSPQSPFQTPPTSLTASPASTRRRAVKVDVFVSVDVEERMQDGLYSLVSVKEDSTLRLSQNASRRLVVRIVQADQQPFCFSSISQIRIAPEQSASFQRGQSSFESSSSLGSATLGGFFKRFGSTKEISHPAEDSSTWSTLTLRAPCQIDNEARSIVCSMKWDSKKPEIINARGHRRVFRIALALDTNLSQVPVIISTKFTTKILPKVKKETAWWAKEQVSRMHRLGHWYSVDVGQTDSGASEVVAEKLLDHYGQGIERLEVAHAMEKYRQQIVAEDNIEQALQKCSAESSSLTSSPFWLHQDNEEWVVASLRFPDMVVHVYSGVTMTSPQGYSPHAPLPSQAISDPSALDPYAGEMSGYLMLHTTTTWNRRWFVLQRPLLHCYKTFAKCDIIGVLDISKCEISFDRDALFPFSFHLTSTVDKAPRKWLLQASTSAEMRAWCQAIRPLVPGQTD